MINTVQRVINTTVLNTDQEYKMFAMHPKHSKYFTISEKLKNVYKQYTFSEISIQISMLETFLCQVLTPVRD